MNCIKWTLIKLASIHINMIGVFFLHNYGCLTAWMETDSPRYFIGKIIFSPNSSVKFSQLDFFNFFNI